MQKTPSTRSNTRSNHSFRRSDRASEDAQKGSLGKTVVQWQIYARATKQRRAGPKPSKFTRPTFLSPDRNLCRQVTVILSLPSLRPSWVHTLEVYCCKCSIQLRLFRYSSFGYIIQPSVDPKMLKFKTLYSTQTIFRLPRNGPRSRQYVGTIH